MVEVVGIKIMVILVHTPLRVGEAEITDRIAMRFIVVMINGPPQLDVWDKEFVICSTGVLIVNVVVARGEIDGIMPPLTTLLQDLIMKLGVMRWNQDLQIGAITPHIVQALLYGLQTLITPGIILALVGRERTLGIGIIISGGKLILKLNLRCLLLWNFLRKRIRN